MKRAITLIEILVAIALIAIVASVVGYNVKGGLDKGKEFKDTVGRQKLEDILNMQYDPSQYKSDEHGLIETSVVKKMVKDSQLIAPKDIEALLVNSRGVPYRVTVSSGSITVH